MKLSLLSAYLIIVTNVQIAFVEKKSFGVEKLDLIKLQINKFESKRACPGVNLKLTSKIFNKACLSGKKGKL